MLLFSLHIYEVVKVGLTPGHGTSALLASFQSCEYAWSNLSDVEGSTVRYYANSSE